MQKLILAVFTLLSFPSFTDAQPSKLKPGFDQYEFLELLKISALQIDTPWTYKTVSPPEYSKHLYRSPITGLRNMWDLWMLKDDIAVISLRGTTAEPESWLENFYLAMVPASGSLKLSDTYTFDYHLATHPQAAVHLGWLIGMASMQQDIVSKIDSLNENGVTEVIIMGHSQGGGIAYLLTSHLLNLQRNGHISKALHFKTYCSAAPKPGNMYYAYDFENITQFGWAFNVVNAADWVPETPASVQNKNDFVLKNPFTNANLLFKKQKFPNNIALNHLYKRLTRPTEKVRKRYMSLNRKQLYKQVKKVLPQYEQPDFFSSINFQRAGTPVVLMPDENYFKIFENSSANVFVHHFIEPYIYLLKKMHD